MSDASEQELEFTVAAVWREARVSCPHPDILKAYDSQSLPPGAMEFLDFHLNVSECPYCNSVLMDIRARQQDAEEAKMSDLKDRLMRSTVSALRRASGA